MKKIIAFGKKRRSEAIKLISMTIIIALTGFMIVGCNESSSSGTSNGTASEFEGVFVDSPVEGLDYMTQTHTGITDEEGRFICFEGEMITFMIGDIILGQAVAGEVMTPMDFLDESEMPFDVTHPVVTNMGRFLQSLDSDGKPENGITISAEVREEVTGRMIDFHQSIEDFENDPDVVACFDVLNGLNMPHNGYMWDLVSTDQAQQHMITHMGEYMEFASSDDSDGDIDDSMDGYMDEQIEEYMGNQMGGNMGM